MELLFRCARYLSIYPADNEKQILVGCVWCTAKQFPLNGLAYAVGAPAATRELTADIRSVN